MAHLDLSEHAGAKAVRAWKSVLVPLTMLLIGLSLDGACRKVASAFDCRSVCARYRDCIDIKYDVGACQQRCRERAGAEDRFQHKADACEDCIKGQSCMGATFECGGKCLGVVP